MNISPKIQAFKGHLRKNKLRIKDVAEQIGITQDSLRQSIYRGTLQEELFTKLATATGLTEEKLRDTFSVGQYRKIRGTAKDGRNILPLIRTVAEATGSDATLSLCQLKKLLQFQEQWGEPLSVKAVQGLLCK